MSDLEPRQYPLPKPDTDPRFSFGLMLDLAAALEKHGYPKLVALDIVELQQVLYGFLYRAPAAGGNQ